MEHPVTVYIAPGIYWLEDPQSEAVIVREDPKDLYPYGCKVNCANLKLVGLSENPEDVVIAANRGNDHGAKGNYTLFHFSGEQLEMENLTLGNYCCVDLDYALDPAQSVKRGQKPLRRHSWRIRMPISSMRRIAGLSVV